jgi:hypothetical protein
MAREITISRDPTGLWILCASLKVSLSFWATWPVRLSEFMTMIYEKVRRI